MRPLSEMPAYVGSTEKREPFVDDSAAAGDP